MTTFDQILPTTNAVLEAHRTTVERLDCCWLIVT